MVMASMPESLPSGGSQGGDPWVLGVPDVMTPRSYQIELLEHAKKENIIVYLETGCGKTHIAVMLLQHIAPVIRKPSIRFAVFLCPTVYLVLQQAKVIRECTDLTVGTYYGEMNVDAWKSETWKTELEKIEVFVMTPAILLQNLHHCFMSMDCIELLIFDECHHADKRHPYACIMQEFYHPRSKEESYKLPRILGMTASPIDGKGQNIERELDKIERLLHAKLHTVKERSELDIVVPRPLRKLEYYEPTTTTNSITQQFSELLSNLKDECIKNLLGTSRSDREMLGDACTTVERKMLKNIEKLYNSLHYCANELGIRCAIEAVVLLLRKYDSNCDTEINSIAEHKEVFLQNAFTTLNSLLSQALPGSESTPCAALDGEADTHHLSSKVQVLISILERYRDTKDMRCIIFVERKIATRVLASLLSSIEVLSCRLRFQPLAGKSTGLNLMNRKLQQHVVESFRDGKVNVLVSTNVAEEGLDIQSCHLVIRFDLPKTPCSFIQSRGRARCLKSTIIYLVERDNNGHSELLQQFESSENSMKEQVLSRVENVEAVRAPDIRTIETFEVESTGASISTLCSVSLLHRYCARLAHDSFYTPRPEFSHSEGSWGHKCTVTLPTDALVQVVEGRPTSSQGEARRSACLLACQRLYEAGALTDLLLLKSDENEYPLASTTAPESSTKGKIPHPLHSTIVPDAFSGTWLPGLASIELHAYAVTFVASPNDRAYVNFGLFLEADLGPEAGSIEVELQLTNRRLVNAKCLPCGTMRFEPNQLRDARLFQERIFSAVLDQKPGSKVSGEWSSERLYLLLPLKENHELSLLPIDWNCIQNLISEVEHIPSDRVPPGIPGSSLVRLCDGYVSIDHVIDSAVQTVHNGCIYCARELIPNLTGESPMVMKDPRYSSYSDYYEQKHKTKLKFLNQPMLKAKPLIQVHNLLTQRTTSERPAAEEQKAEALVELPLELCKIRVKGLSCGLANGVSLLPSFMHRLEGLLLAIQLRRSLPVFHPDVSANLMLEAITTSKCQESFSLEGLELLGDAFLEVSVSERLFLLHNRMQEGKLSKLRTSLICNTNLERLGRERGLMDYIRDTQFSPKYWAAPGRANESCLEANGAEDIKVHPRYELRRTRLTGTVLQGKTIADVFEALIGAHYIHGGVDAAQAMMGWLGCEVGVDPGVREEARTRSHGQLELLPDSKVADLETLLQYKFQNRGLLVEALTHASCPRRSGDCYQRLEFLGDAVLDFLITKHFYENSAKVKRDPGLLTDLRSAAVNNECFARVAVRHNLHMYLLHSSRDLAASVAGYVKFVHDSTAEAQCHGWKGDGSCKVLSDLVESLAGAVFLDSNFELDTVWRVFEQILRPLVTPETLRLEPIRELRELCQHEKFGELKFNKERGDKGDFIMTVTVQVKNETISESARKPDKKSAKKVAAIKALAALKERGYEHFSRRLLERRALYAQKFSDLVDVPEEECHALASVEEPSAALQSVVQQAVGTFTSAGKFGSAPAPFDVKARNLDPSSSRAAQKTIDRCCETQCTMSSTALVQEQQPDVQCGVGDTRKAIAAQADRRDALAVASNPKRRAVELMSTTESISHSATKSDMAAQPREPVASHPSNSQHDVVRNAAPVQPNPKQNETNDFEKLCLAYRASLNQGHNFVFDYGRPQGQAVTREFDGSKNQTTLTTTTTTTTASMAQPHAMALSEVATALEIQSEYGSVPLAETLLSASEVLLKHDPPALQTTCAPTDSVVSSNGVYTELNSGTSQVLSSPRNDHDTNHHMSSSKQKELCVSDASQVKVDDVPSVDHQDHASAQEPVSTPVVSASEPLTSSHPHQLDLSRLVPGQAQPRPAPEMAKGEARSLLNVICMKHRWHDPVYTLIWKGGVSHAPLFIYMVQTTISLGGQAFEVDVEGEVERDVKGAKDSAAARLLAWFREQGVPLG